MQYKYTDFNIENDGVVFGDSVGDKGVLISINFAYDTPKPLKDKLSEMINRNMDEWLRDEGLKENEVKLDQLLLNARMQIECFNDGWRIPCYYITMLISDLFREDGKPSVVWLDETYNICGETSAFQTEFKKYCRHKINKILFPAG